MLVTEFSYFAGAEQEGSQLTLRCVCSIAHETMFVNSAANIFDKVDLIEILTICVRGERPRATESV